MELLPSGWAWHQQQGTIYGESYISPYKKELTEMFQMSVEYSYIKMRASKMSEHLQAKHPDSFSIPWETEIKQFISKMSEELKRTQSAESGKQKFTRGRKTSNTKITWHTKLKQILEQNFKEKPRIIHDEFIQSYMMGSFRVICQWKIMETLWY